MDAAHPLITTIGLGLLYALIFGTLAALVKLPPIVGYLCAGILLGPYTPGIVGDASTAYELAELGVILLMFGVGLHFSPAELLSVRRVALPGAVTQMATATILGALLARGWDYSWPQAVVFGLALSVASTVVLLRALADREETSTPAGRIAVGWLVVEDLAVILVLVMLPAVAGMFGGASAGIASRLTDAGGLIALGIALGKVALFIAIAVPLGRRVIPWVLVMIAHLRSRELFTLAVLALSIGIAYASAKVFGVSFALGAFFAGMVMHGSGMAARAAEQSLPFRDAFAVLFFVSVGMLFNPLVLVERPGAVAATLGVVIIGKGLAAAAIMLLLRQSFQATATVTAALAQIGEFSLVLAEQGIGLGLLPEAARDPILAAVVGSIALNPLMFWASRRLVTRRDVKVQAVKDDKARADNEKAGSVP
ncbi:cation:proton antiporter [Elioraea sp.]|uniref:cation:proton antiporter domain-containing protein n=1 Tax=Elioraea sp. TaxID=2185103 RepID=UPI0025BB8139|nr:cation:proton antiporter [Elioraea sp.]